MRRIVKLVSFQFVALMTIGVMSATAQTGESGVMTDAWVAERGGTAIPPNGLIATDRGDGEHVDLAWIDLPDANVTYRIEQQSWLGSAWSAANMRMAVQRPAATLETGVGQFRFRVIADTGRDTAASGWVSVTVVDAPPATPQSLMAVDVGNERDVALAWTAGSSNASAYHIQHEFKDIDGIWVATDPVVTADAQTGLIVAAWGGEHRYAITATNAAGSSAATSWSTVTVASNWTQFTKSADTRIVYVSSSEGNDANSGLSRAAPKATLQAGYGLLRNGYPDWMLVKRGDIFSAGFGGRTSGRNASNKLVIATYGASMTRPVINYSGPNAAIERPGGGSSPTSYVAIVGLSILRSGNPGATGVSFVGKGTDILLEDLYIEGFANNVVVQADSSSVTVDRFTMNRCVIYRSHDESNNRAAGLFASYCPNFRISECVFDQNGWDPLVPGSAATVFSRHIYFEELGPDTIDGVYGCILTRSASDAAQLRMGGSFKRNLLWDNASGVWGARYATYIEDNVLLDHRDINPGEYNPSGWGIEVKASLAGDTTPSGSTIKNNLLAHNGITPSSSRYNAYGIQVSAQETTCTGNVLYDWLTTGLVSGGAGSTISHNTVVHVTTGPARGPEDRAVASIFGSSDAPGVTRDHNAYYSSRPDSYIFNTSDHTSRTLSQWNATLTETNMTIGSLPSFPEPSRDLAAYEVHIAGSGDELDFIARARQQSRFSWDSRYTADAANAWIRAGYGF